MGTDSRCCLCSCRFRWFSRSTPVAEGLEDLVASRDGVLALLVDQMDGDDAEGARHGEWKSRDDLHLAIILQLLF
jgi:hypothetical protein